MLWTQDQKQIRFFFNLELPLVHAIKIFTILSYLLSNYTPIRVCNYELGVIVIKNCNCTVVVLVVFTFEML